jgi:hypothetical protein
MQELEPTWKRALSVWWLITWRGFIGFLLLVFASVVLVDSLATLIGGGLETLSVIGAIGVWVLSIIWGLVVVRMALRKHYRHFRVALISNVADAAVSPSPEEASPPPAQ